MKTLFVRTYCPNPIFYGSEMRGSRLVAYLHTKGDVDLLTLTKPTEEYADINYIKNNFRKHYYFDQKGDHQRLTSFEKFKYLLPWQIEGHYAKDFQEQLNKIVEENQYDLIFVFKLEPVFFFLQLPRKWHQKIVIDFDDILSDLYLNHYKNWLTAHKNSYSMKIYEYKALTQFKRTLVCSRHAVETIPAIYRRNVSIVPNIFESSSDSFFPAIGDPGRLLFVGSLDYFPNTDGLKWFFNVIWPEFKKIYPLAKLSVIGKAQKEARKVFSFLGQPQDVEVTLNVPSVLPYYKDCFASIVPLLNGSGTRLKILESVAYGRPVITTPKGMEGLDFSHGQDIFTFNDAASFISGYRALLDQRHYTQITQQALHVLQNGYSMKNFTSSMDISWGKIIS